MKKVLSVVLSVGLVAFVGCSGKQAHNSDRSSESAKAGMSETSKDRQEALDRLNDSAKVLDE